MDVQFSSIQGIHAIAIQTDHYWMLGRSTAASHKQTSAWSGIAGRLWTIRKQSRNLPNIGIVSE